MDTGDNGVEDNTQKRKRRPKSYQGCTQCRLARRKCGEGILSLFAKENCVVSPLPRKSSLLVLFNFFVAYSSQMLI